MSGSNNNRTKGRIGILGVVEIVFIILKLLGVVDWNWWIVLIPVWFDLGISLLIIIIAYYFD